MRPLPCAAATSNGNIDTAIALAICALVLFFLSNAYPLVSIQVNGATRDTTLVGAALAFYAQDHGGLAALVFITTVAGPFLQICSLLYLLVPLRQSREAPGQNMVFRLLAQVRPWTFIEVFMLGVLVALVRLSAYARVIPGVALWSCVLLMLTLRGFDQPHDARTVLALGGREPQMRAAPTGRSLGLMVCLQCRATVRALQVAYPRCPRCYAHLYQRKPHSLGLTAALLICAAILYIPANLLPVMVTRTLFDDEQDTIMSGVLVLLHSGSWPIAVLVFVASIVVPLLKILSLSVVLFSAWRRSPRYRTQRSELFRMVEFIGRWSMLDVYAISLLVALVQIRSLAFVSVGWGALAFASVVVLTTFAARTFDERLLWEEP